MPKDSRALTRAVRSRAETTGETYTQARETVVAIRTRMAEHGESLEEATEWVAAVRERMAEADETWEEAAAVVDDPANELLCVTCGWTVGMVCPECIPGCGCNNGRCSGWRHSSYAFGGDEFDEDDEDNGGCPECGAGSRGDPYRECVCYGA